MTPAEGTCAACGGQLTPEALTVVCNGRSEHAGCHQFHAPQDQPEPRQYDPVLLAIAREVSTEAGVGWGFAGNARMMTLADAGLAMLTSAREGHAVCVQQWQAREARDPGLAQTFHGVDAHLPAQRWVIG